MMKPLLSMLLVGLALTACAPKEAGGGPAKVPEKFKVEFTTTVGNFTVEATRAWAPLGAERFHEMVDTGFYQDIAFFRVIGGFMVQFGVHGDPAISAKWKTATIKDDPVIQANERGTISFATGGPNTRTTQLFINFQHNKPLNAMGFAPFAKVIQGMDVVDKIYKVGEGAPGGPGPFQGKIQAEGNAYLKKEFPKLDYIKSAKFVQ
ncbi:MAG: peptidylprolyl isomerase [Planctomycetota bacterium]|nr:peptidylprolyl isomerase [Planctomycetota bacterium]